MWKNFINTLNTLPLAAIVDNEILCVHSGISPELHDLSQIANIVRPTDCPDIGKFILYSSNKIRLLCDLLFANPDDLIEGWYESDIVSFSFGRKALELFLVETKLKKLIRVGLVDVFIYVVNSNLKDYQEMWDKQCISVFGASNYEEFGNYGSAVTLHNSNIESFSWKCKG
jgi:serine/threonine-protein phosphatase PP1 catalytic subunit